MNRRWLMTLAAVAAIFCGGVAVSITGGEEGSHSVAPEEGGEWDYGASAGRTWSNFLNDDAHQASVQGHEFVDSGCVRGEAWARAETSSRWISILNNEQHKNLC